MDRGTGSDEETEGTELSVLSSILSGVRVGVVFLMLIFWTNILGIIILVSM